jgi:hypothetical protein
MAASKGGHILLCRFIFHHPKLHIASIFPALHAVTTHMDVIRLLVLQLLEETDPFRPTNNT